ncbi:MAG: hypothetical protein ACRC1X_10505 [Lactobacillus panisapium]
MAPRPDLPGNGEDYGDKEQRFAYAISDAGGGGGGGGSTSAATIAQGIDLSADINTIVTSLANVADIENLLTTGVSATLTSASSTAIASGIDASVDVESIKTFLDSINGKSGITFTTNVVLATRNSLTLSYLAGDYLIQYLFSDAIFTPTTFYSNLRNGDTYSTIPYDDYQIINGDVAFRNLTLLANGSSVAINTINSNTVSLQISGTYSGVVSLEGTINGSDWINLATLANGFTGISRTAITGYSKIRLTMSSFVSGTANVTLLATEDVLTTASSPAESFVGGFGANADTSFNGLRLAGLNFTNESGATVFVQVHAKATALTTGNVPLNGYSLRVPNNSTLVLGLNELNGVGISVSGIGRVGISTTRATYTANANANTALNLIVR